MLKIESSNSIDRQLLNMAARFDPGSGHMGFVVNKTTLGQVFSGCLGSLAKYCNHCSTLFIIHE
jgi:hypothetical protein